MNLKTILCCFVLLLAVCLQAQTLRPGFSKEEYIELMKISAQFGDTAYRNALPKPDGQKLIYQSPVVGLDNAWQLWMNKEGIPVISIRGTTKKDISWLENFYAAMVPAQGVLKISNDETFTYQLATNPKAAVHVGWLIGTAFLSKTVLQKVDSLYKSGRKEMLIVGHSQGGAIAYLLNAYLQNLQKQARLPADIRFKTYCSAGPKPGNLYFAYEYEAMTQGGWAYNVVNSADWVPETPFSIQTVTDFNEVNPFTNAKDFIKKESWPKRWALSYAFGRLRNPSNKAAKNFQKYLGIFLSKSIKKHLPGFEPPAYFNSNDYVRTGATIVLLADENYFKVYPQDKSKLFIHHYHGPYLLLASKLP